MDIFFSTLFLVNLFNYLDRGIIFTLLPNISQEFNLSKLEEGFLISCFMIGFTLSSLFFSIITMYIKRFNKLLLLIFGYSMFIVSSILMFTIKTRNQLYFARCLSGVGEGVFQCLVPYLLNQIYGEERGNKKLGFLFMAINLGISIGLLLGGVIPNRHYLYSAISFIEFLLLISLIYYRNTPIKNESQSITEYQKFKLILGNQDWWFSIIIMSLINYSLGTVASWIPTLYKQRYEHIISYKKLSIIISGIFVFCSLTGSYVGNALSIFYIDKYRGSIYPLYKIGFVNNILVLITIYLTLIYLKIFLVSVIFFSLFLFFISVIVIPNSLINIISIPVECRIYGNSLCIFFIHLLGDLPAPIITSYIWEKTNDLVLSLELSQVSIFISLLIYFIVIFIINRDTSKSDQDLNTNLISE